MYCYSITVVCIFSPTLHPTPSEPTSLPRLHPPPWFCPCVLYSSSCNPLSPLSLPHSPVAIVTMFLISMPLVIFCLLFSFVDYVPVKGAIIWYLSLTAWLTLVMIPWITLVWSNQQMKNSDRSLKSMLSLKIYGVSWII